MSDEVKRVQIRWRRILFGFHLLIWLMARLAVGSIGVMPPLAIYDGLEIWGIIVVAHGALLAILDGRDQARLPFDWMCRLIEPRERRWSLLLIDAALWIILTMAIASRVIPEYQIIRYAAPLSLLWLALTAFGVFHILLTIYAEVCDRAGRKRKNDETRKPELTYNDRALLTDDGELIDFPPQQAKYDTQRD